MSVYTQSISVHQRSVNTNCYRSVIAGPVPSSLFLFPLLYSSDSSSLPQQSNCLGGSQQECGRPLAFPFLAKLCASAAAVPAHPALHPRQGPHNPEGSPMMGTPHKASSETDGKPQGSSRKVGKVILVVCVRLCSAPSAFLSLSHTPSHNNHHFSVFRKKLNKIATFSALFASNMMK